MLVAAISKRFFFIDLNRVKKNRHGLALGDCLSVKSMPIF